MRELASTDSACRVRVSGGAILAPVLRSGERVARIQLLPETVLGTERTRRLDPLSQLALVAVEFARHAAGLEPWDRKCKATREGVALGSALGALTTTVRYAKRLIEAGPSSTNPIDFPDSVDGAAAGHVAMDLGLGGPSITFTDGDSSAVSALVYAARQIAWGRATRMHVVAGDRFDPFFAQALADDPTLCAVCPAECVVALVLEAYPLRPLTDHTVALTGALSGGRAQAPAYEGFDATSEAGLSWLVDEHGTVRCGPSSVGTEQRRLTNPSGALELAAAWLAVRGAQTRLHGLEPIAANPRALVPCGGDDYPALAFDSRSPV